MENDNRTGILAQITDKTKALALIGMIVEALFLASLPAFDANNRVYPLLVTGIILLVIVIGLVVIELREKHTREVPGSSAEGYQGFRYEELPDREVLYRKVAELISKAKRYVFDTTWGPDPPEPTESEIAAQDGYLDARRQVVKKGLKYWELFTRSEGRKERMQKSSQESQRKGTYKIKELSGYPRKKPLPDFMVIDDEIVVLSHVHIDSPRQKNQYLIISCSPLAKLFADWFMECWNQAEEIPFRK